jgi:hypothetical protein
LVISTGDWLDLRKLLKTYQNAEPDSLYSLVSALAVILTETFKIREDKKINPYEYSKGLV